MTQQQENNRKLLHDRGICVIIPTYNNAGTIERVVRKTCEYCDDVIVVNDGMWKSLDMRRIRGKDMH